MTKLCLQRLKAEHAEVLELTFMHTCAPKADGTETERLKAELCTEVETLQAEKKELEAQVVEGAALLEQARTVIDDLGAVGVACLLPFPLLFLFSLSLR